MQNRTWTASSWSRGARTIGSEYGAGMSRTAFLTDSTLCIGCKACEVACKEWNAVGEDGLEWSGFSYDNTGALGHSTWRHVKFVEHPPDVGHGANSPAVASWTFSSDVCKHCDH